MQMRNLLLLLLTALPLFSQSSSGELHIYAIDVEGGKATLYVSPSGESLLIDAGYAGNNNRDADRIVAAAKAAGVKQINYFLVTHFHNDHMGGVAQLAAKIPIRAIYDRGESVGGGTPETQAVFKTYSDLRRKYPHTVLKAGDKVPIKGLQVDVVSASGTAISSPLPGAGKPNSLCATYKPLAPDPGENAHSLALIIRFGKFRVADLGDLFWNQEYDLVCPNNKLGTVDLYMTTHHGANTSGPPQIVHALHPKVAIMNNGAKKGGSIQAWDTIHSSPGLIDFWQLHTSNEGGKDHNTTEPFVANPSEPCDGKWIEVSARSDGSFKVRNSRNNLEKTYKP
jgi:beta-lactamase superfamily II metal-dependent hydrolase